MSGEEYRNEGMEMEVARPVTAVEIRAQVQAIQEVMKAVMKEGVHYGKIPGCGDKPTLLKPGAEKIMATFRLAANPEIEDLSTFDEIRYRVKVHMTTPDGTFVGAGIGECSTNEEKYKWRKAVCKEEFSETPEDRRRKKWKAGWNGKAATTTLQVRTNPADLANTVLKMAKKRGMVDGTLTATGASDVFEQDIEDMPEGTVNHQAPGPSKTSTVKPQGQPPASASKPAPAPQQSGGDEKSVQRKLMDEIGAYCGGDEAAMKKVLEECSYFKTGDGKEKFLTSFANISDKWAGSTLRALRERVKKDSESMKPEGKDLDPKLPDGCTHDPKSCEHSTWSDDKALCGDKECEFGPF
jgi:hypothetical protein